MEFITVEQFREQPKEVQKIFLDWWQCEYGDLYYYNEDPLEYKDAEIIDNDLECDLNGDFEYFKSIGPILLFTEGQLRKFIEYKINGVIKNTQWHIEDDGVSKRGYSMHLLRKNEYHVTRHYFDLGEDLLQAYWKVACEIAKEEVYG